MPSLLNCQSHITFHCMNISQIIYPFSYLWIFSLIPVFQYYEQCWNKHSFTCLFVYLWESISMGLYLPVELLGPFKIHNLTICMNKLLYYLVLIYTSYYCEISYCSISSPTIGIVTLYILSVWWVYDIRYCSFNLQFPDQYFGCSEAIWILFYQNWLFLFVLFSTGLLFDILNVNPLSYLCHTYLSLIFDLFLFLFHCTNCKFNIQNYCSWLKLLPLRLVPFCILFRKCFHSLYHKDIFQFAFPI